MLGWRPTMRRTYHTDHSSRAGAALIVALGVLSLVLLLATAFVLSMQTERMAVRNASEKTNARGFADIGVLDAAFYLEPETNLPFNFVTPHAYWRDDVIRSGGSGQVMKEGPDDGPIRRAYADHSIRTMTAEIQDLLAGSAGVEIGGMEAVVGGPNARYTDFPPAVTNYLPPSLAYQLSTNALPTRWEYITSVNENNTNDVRLTGRVTFFLADISGLADIRHATSNQLAMVFGAESPPTIATATSPLDLAAFLAGDSEGSSEGAEAATPTVCLDTFTTFSLDPDPWQIPYRESVKENDAPLFLGNPNLPTLFTNKFDLACLTNSAAGRERILGDSIPIYQKGEPFAWWRAEHLDDDLRDSLVAISNALFHTEPRFGRDNTASNRTARALFWNLLNDLDADRYPQTDTDEPWLDDIGVEALPLVSEFTITNTPANALDIRDTTAGPYEKHCPACEALEAFQKETLASDAPPAYLASTELWHPFFATNGIPDETHVALHLWKTTYTNDILSALDRVTNNLSTVTETLVAHWGTNVIRRSYRIPRGSHLDFPETATHTLQYGTDPALGAYAAAGILPEGDFFIPDVGTTADVTFSVDTNASALIATTISTTPPLHLFDALLEGPLASLLDGDWEPLEYTVTTNADDEAEVDADPVVEYTTTFTFLPHDETLIDDLLAEFSEKPSSVEGAVEPPAEGTLEPPAEGTLEPPAEGTVEPPAEGTLEPPAEGAMAQDDGEGSGADPPVVVPEPPSLVLPISFTASINDFGETVALLALTPESETLDRIRPFIPRLLRSDDATVTTITNAPPDGSGFATNTVTRYELFVWYEIEREGPESHHGTSGLLAATSADFLSDASCVLHVEDTDFRDRFACATNETPFYFEFPCVHSAFATNGTLIATHTVTNLLPIGLSAVTNVVYEQNPGSQETYPTGEAFDWSAVTSDFTRSNLVVEVLSTLHFAAQLYLKDDNPENADGLPYADGVYPYNEAPGVGSDAARSTGGSGASSGGSEAEPPSVGGTQPSTDCWLLETARLLSIAVDDPRFNGHTYEWYDVDEPTPGDPPARFPGEEDEESFSSVYPQFAGYPVLHHDGLPSSIGDIGYLGTDKPWETLDLFDSSGAKLLDLWCLGAPATNEERRAFGRIHACTPFPNTAALLFADTLFGTNRLATTDAKEEPSFEAEDSEGAFLTLARDRPELLDVLTNAVCTVGWTFSPQPTNYFGKGVEAFSGDSEAESPAIWPFAQWLDALSPHLFREDRNDEEGDTADADWRHSVLWKALDMADGSPPDYQGFERLGRDFMEDLIRDLPDRITFRQNLALVFVRSDSLAPNGRVLASAWTVALLWRDAWTGQWFVVRSQELR